MKRLTMFIIMVMAVGAVATAEAKQPRRSERTVQGTYGPGPAPVTNCGDSGFACLIVRTKATEAFFSTKVTDAHGRPVFVEVYSHAPERGGARRIATFCGETARPIPFVGGHSLAFHIGLNNWGVTSDCLTNRVKTTGTIRVTLSNQK